MLRIDADSLLWNWARWCNSGAAVGNMADYIPFDDDNKPAPICIAHAEAVHRLHQSLPHYQRMIVIAEYPQRRIRFHGLNARSRSEKARRWIYEATGIWVRDFEYQIDLSRFIKQVEVKLL